MTQKNTVWMVGTLVLLAGCVSSKEYRRSQGETAKCLTEKETLNHQVDSLTQDKAQLQQESAAKEAELAKMKGSYDEVVGNLKNEISSGQIQVTQLKDKLTLNMVEKILFDSGQATVKESGKTVLDHIAAALKNLEDKDIRVEGYTDDVTLGPKLRERFPTNWELSTARATNVVRHLVEKDGIDPSRMIAAGFGQFHPIVSNETEAGRAQNRRIDIVLVPHEVSGNAAYSHHVAVSSPTAPSAEPKEPSDSAPPMVPAQ